MTWLKGYEQNLFIMFYVLLFFHKFFNNKKVSLCFSIQPAGTCRLFKYENLHNLTNLAEMTSSYKRDMSVLLQAGGCHGIDC